jgi:uncharacterized protein (TIGR02466 family)
MDETNAKLHKILLDKEQENAEWRTGASQKSNIGGWRSKDDLLQWPNPEIQHLMHRVNGAVSFLSNSRPIRKAQPPKNMEMFAWANINRNGEYNAAHIHPGYHWGAVYYVATGKPDPSLEKNGILEFQDPRPAAGMGPVPGYEFGHKFSVQPKPGMLVVFPAWMTHSVNPFFGEGERISIAFNIRLVR